MTVTVTVTENYESDGRNSSSAADEAYTDYLETTGASVTD